MTAPDDAPKVVFTHSRLHMAAQLEKTFERDFLFQKNGRCGMGLGLGWDRIQSPVSSHLLKRKMEVYINLPPNYHCTLLQHRTELQWKEINPHKKLSLVPFPPSSLCHIFYIVIVYNSTVNTYYQSPKPELVLLPSPSSLPSVTFFTLLL